MNGSTKTMFSGFKNYGTFIKAPTTINSTKIENPLTEAKKAETKENEKTPIMQNEKVGGIQIQRPPVTPGVEDAYCKLRR